MEYEIRICSRGKIVLFTFIITCIFFLFVFVLVLCYEVVEIVVWKSKKIELEKESMLWSK